ncbi:MAG: hypothetical protein K0Q79_3657 [Flavipsychrobacter sp.]|jgi:hypothetical protein|nr:hypothetical protein [Flavipsychrobacter sp.]
MDCFRPENIGLKLWLACANNWGMQPSSFFKERSLTTPTLCGIRLAPSAPPPFEARDERREFSPGFNYTKFCKVFGVKKLKFLDGCTVKEKSFLPGTPACKEIQQFLILAEICVYD